MNGLMAQTIAEMKSNCPLVFINRVMDDLSGFSLADRQISMPDLGRLMPSEFPLWIAVTIAMLFVIGVTGMTFPGNRDEDDADEKEIQK